MIDFGASETDAIGVLAVDHGVPYPATAPRDSATPSSTGCVLSAEFMYAFPSGLMIGVTGGVFSSWTHTGAFGEGGDLATPSGVRHRDSLDTVKQIYGDRYASADLLPLYNWGGNWLRVVATVDDYGPVVVGLAEPDTFATATPDQLSEVMLLSAGIGCVPPPLVAPTGPAPIGERFIVRHDESTLSYELLTEEGMATGLVPFEGCFGEAGGCVLLLRSDGGTGPEQAWAVHRVDRENGDRVVQVFDVFVPEAEAEVVWLGVCAADASGPGFLFHGIRRTSDGRVEWVMALDQATWTFFEQTHHDGLCYDGPPTHEEPLVFATN